MSSPATLVVAANQINSVIISLKHSRPARQRRRRPVVSWWRIHYVSKAWQKSSTWQNNSTKFIARAPRWLGFMVGTPKFSQKGGPHLIPNSRSDYSKRMGDGQLLYTLSKKGWNFHSTYAALRSHSNEYTTCNPSTNIFLLAFLWEADSVAKPASGPLRVPRERRDDYPHRYAAIRSLSLYVHLRRVNFWTKRPSGVVNRYR